MKKYNSRRKFIQQAMKAGIAIPFASSLLYNCGKKETTSTKSSTPDKPLNILILGGTSFLGPHQISYALNRGHKISIFTRGKTKPSIHAKLFSQVEQLVGDRENDLKALEGRKWDAVIDNSGHNVEWTKKTAELLQPNCEIYLYTSSTGVYYPYINSEFKEESTVNLIEPTDITDEDMKLEYWYGVTKANSELETIMHFGKDRSIIVRPTYMIGPADQTNRFIHWPIRLQKGGEILVPGTAEDRVQYIDVRDVAQFMVHLIETKNVGTFNTAGPSTHETMHEFIEKAQTVFDSEKSFVYVDNYNFLKEQNIHHIVPWIMPTENNWGSARINNEKALQNGLNCRPITKTIQDVYDWWISDAVSDEQRQKVATDPESVLVREKAILELWKKESIS